MKIYREHQNKAWVLGESVTSNFCRFLLSNGKFEGLFFPRFFYQDDRLIIKESAKCSARHIFQRFDPEGMCCLTVFRYFIRILYIGFNLITKIIFHLFRGENSFYSHNIRTKMRKFLLICINIFLNGYGNIKIYSICLQWNLFKQSWIKWKSVHTRHLWILLCLFKCILKLSKP